jgi:hypothetical protein
MSSNNEDNIPSENGITAISLSDTNLRLEKLEKSMELTMKSLANLLKDYKEYTDMQEKVVEAQVKNSELLFDAMKKLNKVKKNRFGFW